MKKNIIVLLTIFLLVPFMVQAKADYNTEQNKNSIEDEVKLGEEYDISFFFTTNEIKQLTSSNPNVADIKDNHLEIYKAGYTNIVYEDDTTYKVIHLAITDDEIIGNPKTARASIFATLLGLVLITAIIIEHKQLLD